MTVEANYFEHWCNKRRNNKFPDDFKKHSYVNGNN